MVAEQVGVGRRQLRASCILAVAQRRLDGVAGAVEIALAELDLTEPAIDS
jgi:hypothetical protein